MPTFLPIQLITPCEDVPSIQPAGVPFSMRNPGLHVTKKEPVATCVSGVPLSLGANFPANQSLWCPPSLPTNQCPPVCQPIADLSCKEQSGSTLGKPVGFVARPASEQIPMVGRRNTDKAVEQIPTVGRRNTDELIPMWPDSGRQNKPIIL